MGSQIGNRNRFGFGGSRVRIPDRIANTPGATQFAPPFVNPGPIDTSTLGTRRSRLQEPLTIMRIFQEFDDEDVVNNVSQRVTTGLFSGGTASLLVFFTSSVQSGSTGDYFLDIYNEDPSGSTEEIQFAVTYGHVSGGGAPSLTSDNNATLPTQATYFQYRNILLDPGDLLFTFAGSKDSDDVHVINIQRSRLKQKLDKGNWQLTLSGSNGSGDGTASLITLIDDSADVLDTKTSEGGRVFNVVSGSLDIGNATSSIETAAASEFSGGYGLFYPDVGVIILNPAMLSHSIGLVPTTTTTALEDNHGSFFATMQLGASFQARSEENITSTFFFVRVKNRDFNFSNNPSYVTGSVGEFFQQTFVNNPKSYITTVGLYNDANELLAVGKLSAPLLKTFERETLVKIKLDF